MNKRVRKHQPKNKERKRVAKTKITLTNFVENMCGLVQFKKYQFFFIEINKQYIKQLSLPTMKGW